PMTGWIEPGAARRPQSPVKTTRLITRGLVSAKKSRHSAGRGRTSDGLWTVAVIANSNPLPSEREGDGYELSGQAAPKPVRWHHGASGGPRSPAASRTGGTAAGSTATIRALSRLRPSRWPEPSYPP